MNLICSLDAGGFGTGHFSGVCCLRCHGALVNLICSLDSGGCGTGHFSGVCCLGCPGESYL